MEFLNFPCAIRRAEKYAAEIGELIPAPITNRFNRHLNLCGAGPVPRAARMPARQNSLKQLV